MIELGGFMYSYSIDGEGFNGGYGSCEQAIEACCDSHPEAEMLWVGECKKPTQPEQLWDANDWLEQVAAHEDYNGDYWDTSTRDEREWLESLIRPVLGLWLDRHGLRPEHFLVEGVKQYIVESIEVEGSVTRKVRAFRQSLTAGD